MLEIGPKVGLGSRNAHHVLSSKFSKLHYTAPTLYAEQLALPINEKLAIYVRRSPLVRQK